MAGQADERDVYLAMKSSRTAMRIFNKCLFLASVAAFWGYARFDLAFLLPVAVTLAGAVLFLFFAAAVREHLLREAGIVSKTSRNCHS